MANNKPLVVIGGVTQEIPATNSLSVDGSVNLTGTTTVPVTTPAGSTVQTRLSVPPQTLPAFGQVVAMGALSTSPDTSRIISLFDARTVEHQPTIAVFSPLEADAIGLSWEGSETRAYLKTLAAGLGIRIANNYIALFNSGGVSILGTLGVNGATTLSTGSTAPTLAPDTNTTAIANCAFVEAATAPSQLLTDIKTVDGDGSGLDADTLDGLHGSSYASQSALNSFTRSLFFKADPLTVAFTKTGAGTATIKAGTMVATPNATLTFATATTVTMPTLTAGTDYAIYCCDDGSIRADASFSFPTGYSASNSRKIGGFHYAPGGNATAQSGGDTTPSINAYSLWDVKFRPVCPDPRGKALIAGGFWADIYLCGIDAITNGSSKYNVAYADGASPPKIPAAFGGNGSTAYSTFNWWEACEMASAFGMRLPTQQEFMALAYGVTEASSVVTEQNSTVLNAAYTSKWGVIQATGCLWVWGAMRANQVAATAWIPVTGTVASRGSEYNAPNAALFGGAWSNASNSGSRCSAWYNTASDSFNNIGLRCCADHYQAD